MCRPDLVPDCGNCAALCCVATAFDACEDFAIDKPAGEACPHLGDDYRCTIHVDLVARGFTGCAIYDCYGAGQRVTRAFGDGVHSKCRNGVGPHSAFLALRVVHELVWLLTEAAKLCDDLRAELDAEIAILDAIEPSCATEIDLAARTREAHALLRRVGDVLLTRPGARALAGETNRGSAPLRARCRRP